VWSLTLQVRSREQRRVVARDVVHEGLPRTPESDWVRRAGYARGAAGRREQTACSLRRSRTSASLCPKGKCDGQDSAIADIFRFLDHHNLNPKPYRWTADPNRILEKLDRAWEAILEEIYNPIYGTSH